MNPSSLVLKPMLLTFYSTSNNVPPGESFLTDSDGAPAYTGLDAKHTAVDKQGLALAVKVGARRIIG